MTSMRKINYYIYFCFLIIPLLSINGCGPTPPPKIDPVLTKYVISGTVLDQDNNPVEKAEVTISAVQEAPMITDDNGFFKSDTQAKLYVDPLDAVIIIQKEDYTYEGYEEGKVLRLDAPTKNLGRFRLAKIVIDEFDPCETDSDDDGYNDCEDDCVDQYNPDQKGCKEKDIDTIIHHTKRGIGIQILPEKIVADILEIYIQEDKLYDSNNPFDNKIQFDRNIFYTDGTSAPRNIQLVIEGFTPDDVDFNDSKCNDINNFLKLVIQKDGKIKKIDCR